LAYLLLLLLILLIYQEDIVSAPFSKNFDSRCVCCRFSHAKMEGSGW